MSDAKVVRIRQNLEKVVRHHIEFISDTLEHAPPQRSGHYLISVSTHIKEIGPDDAVVGTFEFDQQVTKVITIERKVRR